MKKELVKVLPFILLLSFTVNFTVFLWVLDWTIWYDTPWIYIPLIAWNVELSRGEAVNISYWMMCLSLIGASASAYILGWRENSK